MILRKCHAALLFGSRGGHAHYYIWRAAAASNGSFSEGTDSNLVRVRNQPHHRQRSEPSSSSGSWSRDTQASVNTWNLIR